MEKLNKDAIKFNNRNITVAKKLIINSIKRSKGIMFVWDGSKSDEPMELDLSLDTNAVISAVKMIDKYEKDNANVIREYLKQHPKINRIDAEKFLKDAESVGVHIEFGKLK